MDKEFYYNTAIPTWQLLSPAMEIQPHQLNCFSEQSPDSYLNPNWKKSTEQSIHFDSSPSSMVSSPAASHDIFLLRELIGSLVNTGGDPGEISTAAMSAASYMSGNDSTNTSCYNNPMNSPPKLNSSPVMDHLAMQKLSSMENSLALNSSLIELSGDPGNAERAARFSCLGSRSFNGRTRQSEYLLNNNGEFARVASSPSLKALESKSPVQDVAETEMRSISGLDLDRKFAKTLEESPVSEQIPGGESGLKSSNAMNSRKRKAVSRGKAKELAISQSAKSTKVAEGEDDSNPKRRKMIQCHENGTDIEKEEQKGNTNTAEPPKDYIHVRARRGQATDSHSLAERVRREKIGERMKLLQDLVPGCNKVTGKALMLDEIINYVRSLQRQVEFLSMKLASVDFRTDLSMERHLSKDHQLYGHQTAHRPILRCNISNETALCRNFSMQLPPLDGFNQGIAQFPALCEDDLSLVGLARI